MEKETILKVSDLSVNYGYVAAVRNVHLQVCKNEIVTLIGSNGAGKTTTLMAISNLVEKTSGQILFDNEDIGKLPPDQVVRKGIAHVPEGRKIFPRLSVYENLLVGSLGNPKLKKTEIEEQIEYIFSLFPRLKERRKQAGGSLSGGEQPELIMLDEPSMGLAPIIVEDIFELILKIRDTGKTILLIEQNASMALSIADRAYVLETGKITMEGKGSDLLNDENVKKVYLGA